MPKTDETTSQPPNPGSRRSKVMLTTVIVLAVIAQMAINAQLAGMVQRVVGAVALGFLWSKAEQQIQWSTEDHPPTREQAANQAERLRATVVDAVEGASSTSVPVVSDEPCTLPGESGERMYYVLVESVVEVGRGRGDATMMELARLDLLHGEPAHWSANPRQVHVSTPSSSNGSEAQEFHDGVTITLEETGSADRLHIAAAEGCYLR